MNPVVLVQRTPAGDAFRYERWAHPPGQRFPEMTDALQLAPVPVGDSLPVLDPSDVERFRNHPKEFC